MATIATIADAIATAITTNAADLPAAFTVARSYLPRYKLAELAAIVVTVKPSGLSIGRLTRGKTFTDTVFEVAVQKHLATALSNELLDPLMTFTELLGQMFFRKIDTAAGASLLTVEASEPTPDDVMLHEHNVWAAVLRVTYKRGD